MEAARSPLDRCPLRWPFPAWFGLAIFAYLAWTWWQVSMAQIDRGLSSGSGLSPETGATLALLARAIGWLIESGYYVLWWKWRGRTLPFWRYFQWTAAISMVDLLADALRRGVSEGTAGWRVWWIGIQSEAGTPRAWEAALGGVGLLVIARLAMTIRVQREALAPIGWGPSGIVSATWLANRLVMFWTHDLIRGGRLP